jgi:secreted PhoX family phosphatase
MTAPSISRRAVLGAAGALLLAANPRLLAAAGRPVARSDGYGPLVPVVDGTTGLPLLHLPAGFRYHSFGWTGEPLADGTPTPRAHDGMGVVAARGGKLTLVRNHEIVAASGALGDAALAWDPVAGGGTTTLVLDARRARLERAEISLAGTLQNCAGGPTPWGTWLSCEEYVHELEAVPAARGDGMVRVLDGLTRPHGYVFEVDPRRRGAAVPIVGMGRFRHEAAAVDSTSGIVYLTEDRSPVAGFYRYVPEHAGRLADGGRLEMLRAVGGEDLRRGVALGREYAVEWVPIADPDRAHTPGTRDGMGVVVQGLGAGGSAFTRLEGVWFGRGTVYFTATDGGDAGRGQVFAYEPARASLRMIFESTGLDSCNYPDNLTVSPRGGLVLCEDGDRSEGQLLCGLDAKGRLFDFARNAVVLDEPVHGHQGDFRGAEWAGACFSPDGRWLFANIYHPGFTVAITGPWKRGLV